MSVDNDAHGVAAGTDAVRFERLLPGPIERVWSFLVDSGKRARWFADGQIEPRVGGKVSLLFLHSNFAEEPTPQKYAAMDAGGFEMEARVTRWEPPRALGFTWPEGEHESEVTFELMPAGDRVRLVLTHSRIFDLAQKVDVSGGWHAHLGVLVNILEGRSAGPFWSRIEGLEADYRARFGAAN